MPQTLATQQVWHFTPTGHGKSEVDGINGVLKTKAKKENGIPSKGRVEYLYIEKELIQAVWMVFLIFLITTVFEDF